MLSSRREGGGVMLLASWGLGFQAVIASPRERLRCALCGRWTKTWVVQGLDLHADDDATCRRLCPKCAVGHRGAYFPEVPL